MVSGGPPKSPGTQWVDGRSAKEAARAWLGSETHTPSEITDLLKSHADFDDVVVERIEPEALLPFDSHGGPRHADLAIWAHDQRGAIAITVEAKADEPFGQPLRDVLSAGLEQLIATPESRRVARVCDLACALFRPSTRDQDRVGDLRYQLLTATAGTLAQRE